MPQSQKWKYRECSAEVCQAVARVRGGLDLKPRLAKPVRRGAWEALPLGDLLRAISDAPHTGYENNS